MTITATPQVAAGTQVIVRQEVPGSNGAAVHPRSAVGIVTRTPSGAEIHYLISFSDGFKTSLERYRFEVLKHFKDRLPASHAIGRYQL